MKFMTINSAGGLAVIIDTTFFLSTMIRTMRLLVAGNL